MPTRRETLIGGVATMALAVVPAGARQRRLTMTDLILVNAKVTTLDRENPEAQAIAIRSPPSSSTAVAKAAT